MLKKRPITSCTAAPCFSPGRRATHPSCCKRPSIADIARPSISWARRRQRGPWQLRHVLVLGLGDCGREPQIGLQLGLQKIVVITVRRALGDGKTRRECLGERPHAVLLKQDQRLLLALAVPLQRWTASSMPNTGKACPFVGSTGLRLCARQRGGWCPQTKPRLSPAGPDRGPDHDSRLL